MIPVASSGLGKSRLTACGGSACKAIVGVVSYMGTTHTTERENRVEVSRISRGGSLIIFTKYRHLHSLLPVELTNQNSAQTRIPNWPIRIQHKHEFRSRYLKPRGGRLTISAVGASRWRRRLSSSAFPGDRRGGLPPNTLTGDGLRLRAGRNRFKESEALSTDRFATYS